ncbi:hypothetical protein I552_6422 [Mycobacterium xenopi 3993]|nr:hypothetical protein I552_6422 [Mycobacterium xenopi 3993]
MGDLRDHRGVGVEGAGSGHSSGITTSASQRFAVCLDSLWA